MTDTIPARLTAGDAWSWDMPETFSTYPAPTFAVSIVFAPENGGAVTTLTGTENAAAWRFTAASSVTALLPPGVFNWSVLATDTGTGNRKTVCRGTLRIDPDPAKETGDTRSQNTRILSAIEAAIEGRATKDADAFTIEGRSITRTPISDLIRLRNIYRAEVRAERGQSSPFKVRRVTH